MLAHEGGAEVLAHDVRGHRVLVAQAQQADGAAVAAVVAQLVPVQHVGRLHARLANVAQVLAVLL